jgi:uncharacterized protein YgiM (DUF1202 family)
MRKNCILIFATLLSSSLLARQAATSASPAIETPAASAVVTNSTSGIATDAGTTNAAPTKKKSSAKKKTGKRPATKKKDVAELKTVPLIPGPAVVDANHVNVRGQAKLNSEVVTRLSKGQKVTVIEEITHNNSGPDEPSAWARIALPTDAHVWINTGYIDAANKTVKPKKLNVRGGPGENFSVLGRLERGETVNQVSTKGEWTEIEAPTNAYAFVAAQYLKQEPATTATPAEPVATTATVTNETTLAAAPAEAPTNAPAVDLNTSTTAIASAAETPADTDNNSATPKADEPPPRRVVAREGLVRGTTSIQAPTHFELVSPENHRTVDYLYTTSPNLDLRRYKGLRIIVTGEEGLEERWGNTPVITIEKIQVVE